MAAVLVLLCTLVAGSLAGDLLNAYPGYGFDYDNNPYDGDDYYGVAKKVVYPAYPYDGVAYPYGKDGAYPAYPYAGKDYAYPAYPYAGKDYAYPAYPYGNSVAAYPGVAYPAYSAYPYAAKGVVYPAYPVKDVVGAYPAYGKAVAYPAYPVNDVVGAYPYADKGGFVYPAYQAAVGVVKAAPVVNKAVASVGKDLDLFDGVLDKVPPFGKGVFDKLY